MKPTKLDRYKVVIASSNKSIHDKIETILKNIELLDLEIEILNGNSFAESRKILESRRDIALMIVDADMESKENVDLSAFVRDSLNNFVIRIIKINQPAEEFRAEYINKYDINNYGCRLSFENLYPTIRTAVMHYKEIVRLNNKLQNRYKEMTTNPLTHLYNRIKLYEDCNNCNNKTLILIDIIGFSSINENYGYEIGDLVLKELAAFLFSMYHDDYAIYHLDNDLFALTLELEKTEDIFTTVKDIQEDILALNIITNSFNNTLNISIGVAYQNEDNLLRRAELALKEARNIGINQIQYFSEDLKVLKKLKNTNYWGPIIKDALDNDGIVVNYQPIYNLETNRAQKYELLMRLKHNGTEYLPAEFLDAAVDTGQMYDIFRFMFTKACYFAQKTKTRFSVNIGDTEFEHEEFIEFIVATMKEYKVDPTLLSLEILEYNSIGENTLVREKIMQIHELGIAIVIDDFGINCSNFGQMKNLPIDTIKIDGSFIKNLPESKESKIVVKTIQTYAKEKNIKLVAEYISTQKVLENVLELEIEYGQGFYLCRPLSEEQLVNELLDR
ncbi:MAG: GGDEF and EAL domain-containing protein [Campylobacterota bacterium]|nr:GGDEF and EAL domain-containing protein [Campylobacterota bacterium]